MTTIAPSDWQAMFAAHRAGKWPNTLAQQIEIQHMNIQSITEQQVIAWLFAQKAKHNAEISISTHVEAYPVHVSTGGASAVAHTIEAAIERLTKEGVAIAEQRLADAQQALEAAKARAQ